MGVLGEPNASVISGTLILRGQDVKAVVDCAPDWESYNYRKLDVDNEDDKKFFESALAWDLELDGKVWKDGKNVSRALPPFSAHYSHPFLVQVEENMIRLDRCRLFVSPSCPGYVSIPIHPDRNDACTALVA